ncbi:hypothetical protein [Sinomonas susongensis]|nr:hypothetical protein [Sinomonas susongensis]
MVAVAHGGIPPAKRGNILSLRNTLTAASYPFTLDNLKIYDIGGV